MIIRKRCVLITFIFAVVLCSAPAVLNAAGNLEASRSAGAVSNNSLRRPPAVVVEREGQLVRVDVADDDVTETVLPVPESWVVQTFGASGQQVLYGTYAAEGMELWLGSLTLDHPASLVGRRVVAAAWSPSGGQFLVVDQNGVLTIHSPQKVERVADGVAAASFSPDGGRIALVRAPLSANRAKPAKDLDRGDPNSPEVRRAGDDRAGLSIYDMSSAKEMLITDSAARDYWFMGYEPAWSPDGTRILYFGERNAADESFPLWVASLQSMTAAPLHADQPLPSPTGMIHWSSDSGRVFFNVDALDKEPEIWSVQLGDDLRARSMVVAIGRVIGSTGTDLIADTPGGLVKIDDTGVPSLLRRIEPEFAIAERVMPYATTATVYDVKYCRPLTSSTVSSYVSHSSSGGGCSDGGYKYSCSSNNGRAGHKGTDFPASLGTKIYAGAAGVVVAVVGGCGSTTTCTTASTSCNGGQGNYVNVKHSNGAITRYMHMQKSAVSNAASVTSATILGYVGSTGDSTGCHVHFQVDFGSKVGWDPYYGGCSCTTQSLWSSSCSR